MSYLGRRLSTEAIDINTTEVYVRLTQKDLLSAHAAFHPRAQDPEL